MEVEKSECSNVDRHLDPGTSPDSEVINQVSNEDRLLHPAKMDKAKTSKKSGLQKKIDNGICSRDSCISVTSGIASSNGSGSELISTELFPVANKKPHEALKLDNDMESNIDCRMDGGLESAESWNCKKLLHPTDAQGHKNPKCSNSKGKSHNKSKISDAVKSHAENSHRSKGDSGKFVR
ncbi:hypothetical protein Ancab_037435 [Ancistrocladus abbreviatus]